MNERIQDLLSKMAILEGKLSDALHEQEAKLIFKIQGKHVEFEHSVKEAHRQFVLMGQD